MSRKKALLIFDPLRRPEQLGFVTARTEILQEIGDRAWVAITDAQAERFAEQGIAVQLRESVDWIELPAAVFNPGEQEPVVPAALQAPAPAGGGTAYYLVQFIVPPTADWIRAIADLGGEDVQPIPDSVVVFRLAAGQVGAVRAHPLVRWVGIYHPAYALNYQLAGRARPATALELSTLTVDTSRLPSSLAEQGNLEITFFDDVRPDDARAAVEAVGAVIRSETTQGFVVEVATPDEVNRLLLVSGVFSVESFAPPEITNDRGRTIMNTASVTGVGSIGFQANLDGAGEVGGVIDLGLDHGNPDNLGTLHTDVRGRVLRLVHHTNPNAAPTPAAAQVPDRAVSGGGQAFDHGTHVTGSIAGDGSSAGGRLKGVAPAAHVVFQGPLNGGLQEVQAFRLAHRLGARVHNNSWGTPNAGTPPPPTNNQYQPSTSDIDRFCYLYPESLIVFAAGNEEEDTTGGAADGILDMDRIRFEAVGKNMLTVGASESFRTDAGSQDNYRQNFRDTQGNPLLQHASFDDLAKGKIADDPDQQVLFSSRGPVNAAAVPFATGRIKPDIVAPGTNILSPRSSLVPPAASDETPYPSGVDKTLYDFKSGTSMAAPHTSGAALLVRQFYRQRFGKLRQLMLLEGVVRTATPPPDFVSSPSVAPHLDGLIFAWVTPAADTAQKRVVAAVLSRDLTRLHAAPIVLREDVGDSPMPRLARHGEHTLLLHRQGDGGLRLSRYRKDPPPGFGLSLDTGFDTDGTTVVDSGADPSADRPAALAVAGDDVAVIWTVSAGSALRWRRFGAVDGSAREAAPVELGSVATTSPHPYLIHNGTRYAAVWAHRDGDTRSVRFASADDDGNLTASDPSPVIAGSFDIHDPHLAWNGRADRFAVVWCERQAGESRIRLRFVNPDGTLRPDTVTVLSLPEANRVRRPFLATHPEQGYLLVWEDDRQGGQFSVNVALLGENGLLDRRIEPNPLDPDNRRLLRISDTVQDTQGLAALVDADGAAVAWQSLDEGRPDRLDVSATQVSLQGSFQGRFDPHYPLIVGGKYRPHALAQQTNTALDAVAMAWAGGDTYLLRWQSTAEILASPRLALARTDAAGRSDPSYGVGGTRELSADFLARRGEMHWTGEQLACVVSGIGFFSTVHVHLFDSAGDPLDGSKPGTVAFGPNGIRVFDEMTNGEVSPQLGHIEMPVLGFGIIVAYGAGFPFANTLRYAILDPQGQFIDGDGNAADGGGNPIAPVNLFTHASPNGVIGTARHGWFHFIQLESRRSIAIWHQRDNVSAAARFDVFVRRFDRHGTGQGAGPIPLLPRAAGDTFDAMNAVIEPRPVGIRTGALSRQREYGVAWQHRNSDADPWEIRFSRLDRNGNVVANPGAPTPANPNQSNIRVVFPGMADAGGPALWPPEAGTPMHAMEPQLASSYTDAAWRPLPGASTLLGDIRDEWAPSYGLAWVGQPVAGGNRTLYFTVLDENGSRLQLDAVPVPAVPPSVTPTTLIGVAPPTQISRSGVDVRDFELVWNGRVFQLTWTEVEGTSTIRHMHTAVTRHGYLDAYAQPSSALLRATLINGATNINDTSLPNLPRAPITNANRNHGYGWGRVNLRQSLVPSDPVTFYACDDGAVGPGRTARYRFALPADTALLRATLVWTDPPGARIVHNLNLRIRGNGREYHGNQWSTAANHLGESQALAAAGAFDVNQSIEQIVIVNPAAGDYEVEVEGHAIVAQQLYPFAAQPFALVFVGSGPEIRYSRERPCDLPIH